MPPNADYGQLSSIQQLDSYRWTRQREAEQFHGD